MVGPSGTGKSTLLNLITGNLTPQSGKITVDGEEASRDRCADLMFYANQQPHMFMESFWDNVTLFGSFAADAGQESCLPAKKREYLEECADCSLLSGGEKQLISLENWLPEYDYFKPAYAACGKTSADDCIYAEKLYSFCGGGSR